MNEKIKRGNIRFLSVILVVLALATVVFVCFVSKKLCFFHEKTEKQVVVVADTLPFARTLSHWDTLLMQWGVQPGTCGQFLFVENESMGNVTANLSAYELSDTGWYAVEELSVPANIGANGFAPLYAKQEGDRKTPQGVFPIKRYFSKYNDFNAYLERIPTTPRTLWIDDPTDSLYNRPYEPVGSEKRNGEHLYRPNDALYDYVAVIEYNSECVAGKGSAVFLHCWRGPGRPTMGCVAVERDNMVKIMDWLDSVKHPVIILGEADTLR